MSRAWRLAPPVLEQANIVVTLLPATAATENLLNAETLALLPRGASIINPGRGTLIDDDAFVSGFVVDNDPLVRVASESKWNLTKHLGLGGHASVSMSALATS
mgnify:CR=1 FL=1